MRFKVELFQEMKHYDENDKLIKTYKKGDNIYAQSNIKRK